MTGYASIDKPWQKYYSEEALTLKLSDCSLYDTFVKSKDLYRKNQTFLWYYGTRLTYSDMKKKIDKAADALLNMGVKKGDYVAVLMFIDPEVVTLLYAINKVGGIVYFINPFDQKDYTAERLMKVNCKYIFIADAFAEKLLAIDEKVRTKNIVVASPLDNMIGISKFISGFFGLKKVKVPKELDHMTFKEFVQKGDNKPAVGFPEVKGDDPAVVFPTSGTSGHSKGALMSNNAINNNMEQFFLGSSNAALHESALCAIPMFHAFAITTSIHGPIMKGMRIAMEFPSELTLKKAFDVHKVNHVAFMPSIWETFINLKNNNPNLSNLVDPITGSDVLSGELEDKINEFLFEHGSKYPILNGYGLTEVCAAITVNTVRHRKKGSLGYPFCQTTVAIFDPDTGKEKKYGEIGEICVQTVSMFSEYVSNPEKTKEALKKHDDGKIWFHSGDLGYIDEDGFLFYHARSSRTFYYQFATRKGSALKVEYGDIEKGFDNCEYIEKVVASPRFHEYHYNVPVLVVELKEGYKKKNKEEIIEKLREHAENNLKDFLRPVDYMIVDKVPLTTFLKVDYKAVDAMVKK